jgi:hypothetical protein
MCIKSVPIVVERVQNASQTYPKRVLKVSSAVSYKCCKHLSKVFCSCFKHVPIPLVFKRMSMVFQTFLKCAQSAPNCSKLVPRVLQMYLNCVPRAFQTVPMLFPRCLNRVPDLFPTCPQQFPTVPTSVLRIIQRFLSNIVLRIC